VTQLFEVETVVQRNCSQSGNKSLIYDALQIENSVEKYYTLVTARVAETLFYINFQTAATKFLRRVVVLRT